MALRKIPGQLWHLCQNLTRPDRHPEAAKRVKGPHLLDSILWSIRTRLSAEVLSDVAQ
jgi:hypothetical protein